MIGILDIGIGNFGSIQRMISKVGGESKKISSQTDLAYVKKLIIPGVGSFDHGMRALNESGLREQLLSLVREKKIPILGICLGMQLLCRGSEEGVEVGLGLIDATVKKFKFGSDSKLSIPHMGWGTVNFVRENNLFDSFTPNEDPRFYFVHSYYVIPDNENLTIGSAHYGIDFCAAIQFENIFGVQFHPEKSHKFGIALLRSFTEL